MSRVGIKADSAPRKGNKYWKLIPHLGSGGFTRPATVRPKPSEPMGQLYNLAEDPGERKNLYDREPEIVQRLKGLLEKYQREPSVRR